MRILDIALKDLTRSFRSFFAIGMMVVAPLLISGLIYFAFGGFSSGKVDFPPLTVAVVNLDRPEQNVPNLSSILLEMFQSPSVGSWLTLETMSDEAAARQALNDQKIGMAVIIPLDFSTALAAGDRESQLKILQDPTLTVSPAILLSMTRTFIDGVDSGRDIYGMIQDRMTAHGVTIDQTAMTALFQQYQEWYTAAQRSSLHSNPFGYELRVPSSSATAQQKSFTENLLGMVMMGQIIFFAFYTGAYSMMSILREQEEGTLARLFTFPINRTKILAGKFLAVVFTVIIQGLVLITAGALLFQINWGEPLKIAMALLAQVIAASGLGVFLISLVKSSKQAGAVLGGGLTVLGMAGGLFTVALPTPPAAIDIVSKFTPHGWVLSAWKMVMMNQTFAEIFLPVLVAIVFGVVMFAVGAFIFRRRFA